MEELKVASWDVVPELLGMLRAHWPDSMASYYTLEMYCSFSKLPAGCMDSFLLTPNGELDAFATFALIVPQHRYNLVFDSLDPDLSRIKKLMTTTALIDWTQGPNIGPLHERFYGMIDEILIDLGLERLCPDPDGHAYYIDIEEGKKMSLDCPEEVYLAPLREEHAERINFVWPHKDGDRCVPAIRHVIKINGGIGLYIKETEELAAWALYCMYGGPGLLQVEEKHKKKGYGLLAARAITKFVADKDVHPQVFIMGSNVVSQGIFLKIGYKRTYGVRWTTPKRKKETISC